MSSHHVEARDSLNKMESLLLSLGRQPTTDSSMVEVNDSERPCSVAAGLLSLPVQTATMIGRILEDSMKASTGVKYREMHFAASFRSSGACWPGSDTNTAGAAAEQPGDGCGNDKCMRFPSEVQ